MRAPGRNAPLIRFFSLAGLVAGYDIRRGNGAGLFSKEKISKAGDK